MPTLTISALYDYFESFSRELKAINHIDDGAKPSFMDDEEFVEKKDNVKYPCMVLDIPDITPVDEGSENYQDYFDCGVTVFYEFNEKGRYANMRKALDNSRAVLRSVMARLRKDDKLPSSVVHNMFKVADVQRLERIQHSSSNIIGFRMPFLLKPHLDLSEDETELIL